jgi:hypothetical protein
VIELNNSLKTQLQQAKDNGSLSGLTQDAVMNVALLTADELDKRGEAGDVVIASNVKWSADMAIPPVQGGWAVRYVGPKEEGRYGRLVLFPDSQWADTLWKRGQLAFISRFGLTDKQNDVWMSSDFKARHDQPALRLLSTVLSTPSLLFKYLSYNFKWNEEEAMRWDAREGVRHRLYHGSRVALAALTKIMYDNKTIDSNVMHELNQLRAAARKADATQRPKQRRNLTPAHQAEEIAAAVEQPVEMLTPQISG